MTDANNHTTSYGYCECGALYSITDALNNVTHLIHDNQGNLIQIFYPDGYSISNSYNLLHQLVSWTDSSGMTLNNWYNNQGLPTVSSNSSGLARALAYDIDDRVTNNTDANNVSVGATYDYLDRLLTRSYPDGGIERFGYTPNIPGQTSYTNQATNIWLYADDSANRITNEICLGVTTNAFAYDAAGDLLAFTDGNGNTTTWGYDQYGRVTEKLDAAGNIIFKYGYDDDNQLTNRWTPANGTTVYAYDFVGNPTDVKYPAPPSVTFSYDADNRLTNMVDGVGTTAYAYDQVGQLLSEGGLWPDDTVNYTNQNRLRMGLSLAHPNGSPWTEEYGYDNARRLTGVESQAGQFDYTYDPVKLQRLDKLNLPNQAYITNAFDSVARLLSTDLMTSNGTNLDSQNYVYNTAGQRTSETNTAGDYRNYTYDNDGELLTSSGADPGGSTRLSDSWDYLYDAAGNITTKKNSVTPREVSYGFNSLNEITNATIGNGSGFLTPVTGSTTVKASTVTVNGASATPYADDDENELIAVWVTNAWSNSFAYDGKMRRRIERDYAYLPSSNSYLLTNEVHFIYDGNVVIEERNASNVPLVSYTRGLDLSGTFQGAGGIGGLLARTTYGQELPGAPTTAFYHADGNGNITVLMYPNQQLAAKYLYDPFGNSLAMSGPLMNFNKYRFSSKDWNDNSGLYYYLYRFYDPSLQRWPNRDPYKELGGINLNIFVQNDPVNHFDQLGLCRDCSQEYNDCMSSCMQNRAPWPYENSDNTPAQNKAGRYRYCEGKCQKAYMECEAENEQQQNPEPNPSSFCSQHPAVCGIGIGIGIGVTVCIICPECCAVIVITGAPAGI